MAAEEAPQMRAVLSAEQRDRLILDHISLVRYIVGRVAVRLPDSVEREDLESAGIVGLIKAADRFEPRRGVKFATYASAVIRGEVMELLRSKDWAPRSVRRRYRELEQCVAALQRQLGRQPLEDEIARAMRLSVEEYRELLAETSALAVASFEELVEGGEGLQIDEGSLPVEPGPWAQDPAQLVDQTALKEVLARAIQELPERDRTVIALYYKDELTLREIGEVLSVTESRVCQIHTQAIARLRASIQQMLRD
ncbi:MAG: sigma-70 family RNA polymerase sigma factor [Armatimonadota bacterium]